MGKTKPMCLPPRPSALSTRTDAPADLDAVIRGLRLAYRPEADAFVGGGDAYDVRFQAGAFEVAPRPADQSAAAAAHFRTVTISP